MSSAASAFTWSSMSAGVMTRAALATCSGDWAAGPAGAALSGRDAAVAASNVTRRPEHMTVRISVYSAGEPA